MVARYLERRLEQLVEGLAGRVFRGAVQPGELASRLLREADLALVDGQAGPTAPNRYAVTTGTTNGGEDLAEVEHALATFLEDAAAQRGWRLGGPIVVRITPKPTHQGRPEVATSSVPGRRPAWAALDLRAERHLLTDNRILIGRSDRNDIVLAEPEVSRIHALVHREGGRTWVDDLESANGLFVNGVKVGRAELSPSSTVSFGSLMATFRPL